MGTPVNQSGYKHGSEPLTGVLLTNLGTPDDATPEALRRYLGEFLWDPRIVEIPRVLWWLILHGIILRTRPAKSARAYKKIWTENGSPLLAIASHQRESIQRELEKRFETPVMVELGMRYGNPSISSALETLRNANARRILVLPLYPQYSAATTGSTFDAISKVFNAWRWIPEFRMVTQYHDKKAYIDSLVASIREHWASNGQPEKMLFSFHGIPRFSFEAGDPYPCQCRVTARLVAEKLSLPEDSWYLTFQSRFGWAEWVKPYTDATLKAWARSGVRHVDVICPGFSADCLETLEEINMLNREIFLGAGGEQFNYIPALNTRTDHVAALTDIVYRNIQSWVGPESDQDSPIEISQLELSRQRALASGAKD
ncbi:MAG: ferrochelatase [Gammaproteobacteria bacterium]